MINYVTGNLISSKDDALVNTVNTVGVMGKGIALQFKEAFPNNFFVYVKACKNGTIAPGKLLVVREKSINGEKLIINFPTKVDWRHKSKYEYIEEGLKDLINVIRDNQIKSISIPPLGCGNGGLDWRRIKVLMEQYLSKLEDVVVNIYQPDDNIKGVLKSETKQAKLTPSSALLLYAMFYYESLGENSNLFVANKLAYFIKRLGEPTFHKLDFKPCYYGPYSVQIGHILHGVNGKYIKGLEQMNSHTFEPLELQYDKLQEIKEYISNNLDKSQIDRLKQLIELITGFQSTFSLEILASVDFIKKNHPEYNFNQIIEAIKDWSQRKKDLFKERYLTIAFNHLNNFEERNSKFV